jgi:hemolysin D
MLQRVPDQFALKADGMWRWCVHLSAYLLRNLIESLRILCNWILRVFVVASKSPVGDAYRRVVAELKKQTKRIPLPRVLRTDKRQNLEFLDPAAEIRMTPPSPIKTALAATICALAVIALAISYFSKVDVYAVAQGRVQLTGRSKVIQPLYQATVRGIYVQNGMKVSTGTLLVTFDPTEAKAELDETKRQLVSLVAEIARREAALASARANGPFVVPKIVFPSDTDAEIQIRETQVMLADLQKLASDITLLDSKIGENRAERAALLQTIDARKHTIQTLEQRVKMRSELEQQGWESKANVLDAAELLDRERATDASDRGQLLQNAAAMVTLKNQKSQTIAQFMSDYMQGLEKAQKDRDDTIQSLIKAEKKVDFMEIRAPVSGTVQQLSITTIGQVVQAGEQLMTVVPDGEHLEIEALVLDQDIGFVKAGQNAVIKVDAFPFTRYGTITGTVVRVSRDAVSDSDLKLASDTQNSPVTPENSGASPLPKTQNLVYPVTISLDVNAMMVDGKTEPLVPGMTATVEIRTERRTVLDYLLSPLTKVKSEAIHER